MISESIKREHFKDRYSFSCPLCGKELYAEPSILMHMGINEGKGNCPECKSAFSLKIFPDIFGEVMESKLISSVM